VKAGIVVNAAGAWAEEVAALAGASRSALFRNAVPPLPSIRRRGRPSPDRQLLVDLDEQFGRLQPAFASS
jgi:glycine/D-amino acid oxidase-like deaminating enzyme